ncbi:MAG: NAD(+) kinase [Acidobacteria bacterium]|nr:MAG: NAD(+) kinase [Acidobacteriota bacterium]
MKKAAISERPAVQAVGIISRPRRTDIAAVAPGLLTWLQERSVNVFCDSETAECVPFSCKVKTREEIPTVSDLLIVLGGDGTLLAVARLLGDRDVPILPVNLGGLGFLTSVTLEDLYPALEQAIKGRARYSERVMLESRVMRQEKPVHCARALNDAVLNKAAMARIIDLELRVNGEFVCNYKADGLIVATPTGSTAYSLSAGGPIVYPVVSAFVITPICPHTLTNRPLVVPDNAKIEIGFAAGEAPIFLTVDGQVGVALHANDTVALSAAPERLRLVRPQEKTYFSVLRDKLKWGER